MPGKVVDMDSLVLKSSNVREEDLKPEYRPCALRIKTGENRWEYLPRTIRSRWRG